MGDERLKSEVIQEDQEMSTGLKTVNEKDDETSTVKADE